MAISIELCLLTFLISLITGAYGGDYCFNRSGYGGLQWCPYGCCGYLSRECCDANVALIVGLTVLAVLVVSAVIAGVCCCMRRRGARGQVLSPNPGSPPPGVVVTNGMGHTTVTTMGQPMTYTTQAYPPGTYAPPPYPMGPQPYPPTGSAAAMAPPPYAQVTGQSDQAFKH